MSTYLFSLNILSNIGEKIQYKGDLLILSEQILIEKYMAKCVLVYDVLKYINKVRKCTIRDILKYNRLSRQTLYRWVDDWGKVELIRKDYSNSREVDGAHFSIVYTPKLNNFLSAFKKYVLKYFKRKSR